MTAPMVGASPLVAALEQVWAAIRRRHPEVPEVVVVVAAGGEGRRLRWGHLPPAAGSFRPGGARRCWSVGRGSAAPPGRCWARCCTRPPTGWPIGAASRTPPAVAATNRRYAQLARELGLEVTSVDPIGWSATTVPDPTAASYAGVLAELAERLTLWRHQEHPGAAGASRNLLACACGCPRRIRVAPATLQVAPILCTVCQLPFTPTPAT